MLFKEILQYIFYFVHEYKEIAKRVNGAQKGTHIL